MTREAFIRKWLANPQTQYTEQYRDAMRNDLDSVIEYSQRVKIKGGNMNSETRIFGNKDDERFWSDKPIVEGHPKYNQKRT